MNNSEKNKFTGETELLLILLQRYRGDADANKQFMQEVLTINGQGKAVKTQPLVLCLRLCHTCLRERELVPAMPIPYTYAVYHI